MVNATLAFVRICALLLACLALSSCGPALPKLPEIDFTRFPPVVRESIERAYTDAELVPGDALKAAAVAKVLHAHGLLDQAVPFYQHARKLEPASFAHPHLLGAALLERGKYADALEALNGALANKGDAQATKFLLGETLLASGSTVQAGETYRTLGDHPVAHWGLGRTLLGQAAINEFVKALALAPRYGAAWKALADAYRALGQKDNAEEADRAYGQHRLEQPAVDDPELAAVRDLNVSTPGLLSRARQAVAQARLLDAARLYEQALAADPESDTIAASLMGIQVQLKDFQAAEKTYDEAQRRKRESSELAYQNGRLMAGTKRMAEARTQLDKALRLDANHGEAWFELGRLNETEGALEKALDCYGRGLFLDPANTRERFYAGRILAGQKRPDAAVRQLVRALAAPVDDETSAARQTLAGVYEQLKQPERAIAEWREARAAAAVRNHSGLIPAIDAALARLGAKP